MSTSPDAQRKIDLYLAEVKRSLSDETTRENDAIIEELRAHITEKLGGHSPSDDELSRIFAELGNPRDIANEPVVSTNERGRRRTFRIAVVALVLAIAGAGISVGEAIAHIGPPVVHYVRVPDVLGDWKGYASRTVTDAGFRVKIRADLECPSYPTPGRVNMMLGSWLSPPGATITLGVATTTRCTRNGRPVTTTST
jgi:hypothetical protein